VNVERLKAAIRDVPDFPQPGILFRDITPVLLDPDLLRAAIRLFVDRHRDHPPVKVAGIESRGFILGAAVAAELGAGFIPVRKVGKLPAPSIQATYALEYGEATLELHVDAVAEGDPILLIDDLLATGGTAAAAASLIQQLGGKITEIDFLVELGFLHGRDRLSDYTVFAPIAY
jgi:adenine phosphoribosyltransferase